MNVDQIIGVTAFLILIAIGFAVLALRKEGEMSTFNIMQVSVIALFTIVASFVGATMGTTETRFMAVGYLIVWVPLSIWAIWFK